MITQDEAIQMAREVYGDFSPDELAKKHITAFANKVRRETLLEAADVAEVYVTGIKGLSKGSVIRARSECAKLLSNIFKDKADEC